MHEMPEATAKVLPLCAGRRQAHGPKTPLHARLRIERDGAIAATEWAIRLLESAHERSHSGIRHRTVTEFERTRAELLAVDPERTGDLGSVIAIGERLEFLARILTVLFSAGVLTTTEGSPDGRQAAGVPS